MPGTFGCSSIIHTGQDKSVCGTCVSAYLARVDVSVVAALATNVVGLLQLWQCELLHRRRVNIRVKETIYQKYRLNFV